jgi:Holliday junction DNA helicase RuvB
MNTIHDARRALGGLGLTDGLGADQVDEHLGRYLRLGDIGRRGLAFYLCEVEERRLYQVFGFSSTLEYACHRHELGERRARELLHAGAQLRELVLVDEAFCRQEIPWSKVLLLLRIATVEHERAWLERAKALGIRELRREVRLARRGGPPRDESDVLGLPEVRFPVKATLGVVPHEMLETAQKKLTAERGRPATVEEVLELALGLYLDMERKGAAQGWNHVPSSHFRIHLQPSGPADDAPLLVQKDDGLYPVDGTEADGAVASQRSACACCDGEHVADDAEPVDAPTPPALRRRVLARDHHRCRCCGSHNPLHVHHIVLRSEGGRTKAHNLITLCLRCHALVHARLLVIRGRTTKKARFVHRDGRPIHGPDRRLRKGRLIELEAPPRRSLETSPRIPGTLLGRAPGHRVTLEEVPDVVDAAWIRRHASLIQCSGERGLALRPGTPAADTPPAREAAAPRPAERAFEGLVGRDDLLGRLRTELEGARALGEPFPHTLLTGPAGTGKTALATGLATLLGARLVRTNGPLVRDVAVLLRLLASLRGGDVLFLDEVHAVPPAVLEILYQAMAEGRLSLTFHERGVGGAGLREKAVELRLPTFTVLAATTLPARLDRAFVSRFGVREHLAPLDAADLARLASGAARARGFEVTHEASVALAAHARGTPRELLRLLDRALRFAAARGERLLDRDLVDEGLAHLGYDGEGLDPIEQRCVALLRASTDPIAERRLAGLLGVDRETLTQEIEPWLIGRGLLRITRRGRVPALRRTGGGEAHPPESRPSAGRRNSAARRILLGATSS